MTTHLLLGEWWMSNILFGGVFLVAAIFIIALAWYVLRGDRLNRIGVDPPEEPAEPAKH